MENINGKTILAIGAHVGDMELTAGALLASCAVSGGRAVKMDAGVGSLSRGEYDRICRMVAKGERISFG